jgi:hypothetical protein
MRTASLALHEGLWEGSRLRWLTSSGEQTRTLEFTFLAGCGFFAAMASAYLDYRLRIPGHAILRAIFPMALGLAVVPRRGAGTVMGASALLTGLGLRAMFPVGGFSVGALTSLTLTGPLLDLSLRHARGGWRLYTGFALAGLAANVVAFLTRGGAKLLGLERLGARPLSEWMLQASFSYVICGLLAGLVSGVVWFQATRPNRGSEESPA